MTHDMAPNPKAATNEEKQAQQGSHLPVADRLPLPDTSSSEEEVDDNATPQAAGYQPLDTAVNAGTSCVENDNNNEAPDALTEFPRAMREDFEKALATAQERHVKDRDFAVQTPSLDNIPMDEDKVRHIKSLMAKIPPPEKATPTWLDDERWQAALKQRISHCKQHEDFADFNSPEAKNAKSEVKTVQSSKVRGHKVSNILERAKIDQFEDAIDVQTWIITMVDVNEDCSAMFNRNATCLHYLRAGCLPYLTWDLVERHLPYVHRNCVQSLGNLWEARETITKNNVSLRKWACQPTDAQVLVSFVDSSTPTMSGHNEAKTFAVWSYMGKCKVSPEHYVEFLTSAQPTMAQCPVDVDVFTCEGNERKRMKKAVERTAELTRDVLERLKGTNCPTKAMVSITGCTNRDYALLSAEMTRRNIEQYKEQVAAVAVHISEVRRNYMKSEESSEELELMPLSEEQLGLLDDVLAKLNKPNLPVYIPGPLSPRQIREMHARKRLTMFDNSYAYLLTENMCLIDLEAKADKPFVRCADKNYANDHRKPIMEHCSCYTCRNFTMAYLNHLKVTQELFGSMLCMIHNTHAYHELQMELRRESAQTNGCDLK